MSRHPEVQNVVTALVGTWTGEGEGGYPTIDSFQYREMTVITERPDHPALHYEQRAWRKTPDGEVVSHWETGLIRISSDGTVRMFNAQGGRSESMAGSWEARDQGWVIRLSGTGYAGDERVLGSVREIACDGTSLSYTMAMETIATRELIHHLEARLTRRH